MSKLPFMKFFPQDYLYDTRILTIEERGVWMDLLCFLWNSKERGEITTSPQHLAQMVGMEGGRFEAVLNSISDKGICEVRRLSDGQVTLLSRRMRRESDAFKKNAERQQKFRESKNLRQKRYREKLSNALVTPKKSEVRSQNNKPPTPLKGELFIPPDLVESEETVKDWLEYKRQKGQSYKPKGLEALWRTFRAIPKEQRRESVDRSMANNWSGLFPVKNTDSLKQTQPPKREVIG